MAYLVGKGSTLEIGNENQSPAGHILIGQITSISGFQSGQTPEIDVSNFGSSRAEFVLGLADDGEFTVDVIYDPADNGMVELEAAKSSGDTKNFIITLTDSGGSEWRGEGLVKSVAKTAGGVNEVWRATATIRMSDEWTLVEP